MSIANNSLSLVGNAESVMKENSDSTSLPLQNPADLSLGFPISHQRFGNSNSYPGLNPLAVLHQQYLANLSTAQVQQAQAQSMLYSNLISPLNTFAQHAQRAQHPLMASLAQRNDSYRPPISLPSLIPSGSSTHPAYGGLSEATRQAELVRLLQNNTSRELFLHLTQMAAQSSANAASTSTPTTSFSSTYTETQIKTEDSPPENQTRRSSSISPSAYMTPSSLNGSPPSLQVHSSPSLNERPASSGRNQVSPPDVASRPADSTIVSTPVRRSGTTRPDKQFNCKTCGRTFGYKHVLQNHERTHTGEKPFKCGECGKRFTRDHHLKTHLRLHTGEKPYNCSYCDRSFVQVANLRRHIRVHTGEKPYICESCDLRFSDSNQLKSHNMTHSGEKPFSCTKCSVRFRRRHHFLNHKCSNETNASSTSSENSNFTEEYIEEARVEGTIMPAHSSSYEEETTNQDSNRRRGRKNKVPRRVRHRSFNDLTTPSPPNNSSQLFPSPQLPPTPLPEQTEPEDLSMSSSSRSRSQIFRANIALTTAQFTEPIRFPREDLMSEGEEPIVAN